ncbi:MAG: hypothetical protein O3B95_09785 [Chloroflexi bacterium]|nr:hypothetical protein [Chloroflexota bacterium]
MRRPIEFTLGDPTTGEPDLSDLGAIFTALDTCGLDLQELMEGATLPLDPSATGDPLLPPTVIIEFPLEIPDVSELDLPFTEEQINCLISELGEDEIAKLLSGGAPDLSLFSALGKCEIDALSLLAP